MKQLKLSKIEWLAEWFMGFFFDPMYYCQPEVVSDSFQSEAVYESRLNVNLQIAMDSIADMTSVADQLGKKAIRILQRIGKDRILRLKECSLKAFKLMKPGLLCILNWSCHIIKSTLNRVQSAYNEMQFNLKLLTNEPY